MKILVTGATGLVGTALVGSLEQAGHTICRLIRPGTIEPAADASRGFDVKWDPATGEMGGAAVGADAVVNLAGAPIAGARWTPARKQVLRRSRVNTTRSLVQALARMAARPRVLISASAIGYYGNREDEVLTEESAAGTDFLSEIAMEWEAEAIKAEAIGIRVVLARFGVILAKNGGALPQMMRPFRLGLGGKIGSGRQWTSWITVDDVVGILRLGIENNGLRGPVNTVSPQPVRNAEFTKILAEVMHKPAVLTAPAFALRLAMGEMADGMLMASQRVLPAVLERSGYKFLHPDLGPALVAILGNK
jgi:uncharacterized protein (TIGR01777 family)